MKGFYMNITPVSFLTCLSIPKELPVAGLLVVCPFLFLAGLIDSVAGGGGIISLPAYLIAGLPIHNAIATNKLSSTCGTAITTFRFVKNGLVNLTLAVPSVLAAIAGSSLGANLSLMMDERILKYIMLAVLPAAAFVVFNKNLFQDRGEGKAELSLKTGLVVTAAAFVVGMYDGFYGPGTGTFLIIAFTVFAHLNIKSANAQAKVINFTTNVTALAIYLLNGKAVITLGLAGAVCNMIGNYLGSGLVMSKGAKIVKPVILVVLALLVIKIISELL